MKGNIFKKILKGVGKEAINITDDASRAFDSGASFAKKVNDKLFREITEDELKNNYSIMNHLTKRKAKTSTNVAAFGGLALYGAVSGGAREAESVSMGEISAGSMYGTTDTFTSPILDRELDNQRSDQEAFGKEIQKNSKKYGSAGPDLVFALHDLRNR